MKVNRITLVTLAAEDVPALAAFYERLGWVREAAQEGVAFFDMGGAKFGIYDKAMLAKDLRREPGTMGNGAMTLAQNFPDRESVDAAFAKAIAEGGTICGAPEAVFWGGYSGTWADPEGHVWEYAHNPFWELDADGRLA